MLFDTKNVVVTGGTGALGTAVTAQLLGGGANVFVPVFDQDEADRSPHRNHDRVRLVADVDLTDEAQVEGFYAKVGPLWASVHIAGGFGMSPIETTSAAHFDQQMAMNAKTCFLCTREAVKAIRATDSAPGGGRIVNVAARPGLEPREGAGMAAYAASKAAVVALTQAIGEEVAKDGIWVNAVAPSILDTPANREAMADADHGAWPKVDEVATTIVHLASSANGVARCAIVPVYGKV